MTTRKNLKKVLFNQQASKINKGEKKTKKKYGAGQKN